MFGNMGKMIKLAAELKTKLPRLKEELDDSEYEVVSEDGGVTVTVNGTMKLVDLKLADGLLEDPEISVSKLAGNILAAAVAAQAKAREALETRFRELTGGMEIPGLSDVI